MKTVPEALFEHPKSKSMQTSADFQIKEIP